MILPMINVDVALANLNLWAQREFDGSVKCTNTY